VGQIGGLKLPNRRFGPSARTIPPRRDSRAYSPGESLPSRCFFSRLRRTNLDASRQERTGPMASYNHSDMQPDFPEIPAEPQQPIPPRYRWLRRLALASVVFVVYLALMRVVWGWEADRRFKNERARWRAAGEPVHLSDLQAELDLIPEVEDALPVLKKALDAMNEPGDLISKAGVGIDTYLGDFELLRKSLYDVATLFEGRDTVFVHLHDLRTRRRARWALSATDHLPQWSSDQRMLARFLTVRAHFAMATGDRTEAVEQIRHLLVLGETTSSHPSMIGQLMAMAISALGIQIIEDFGDRILVHFGPEGPDPSVTSSKSKAIDISQWLLDEEHMLGAIRTSLLAERAFIVDTLAEYEKKGWTAMSGGLRSYPCEYVPFGLLRPAVALDGLDALSQVTRALDLVYRRAWVEVPHWNEPDLPRLYFLKHLSHPLNTGFFKRISSSYQSYLEFHIRTLLRRRFAAVALAAHAFRLDQGRFPIVLDELVPAYVASLPIDPYSADSEPIRFRPDAEPVILYSVGLNGVDDGGAWAGDPDTRQIWKGPDIPFFLAKRETQMPVAQPNSPQAVPNDPGKDESGGPREKTEDQKRQP